jgi:hypothetical protein
MTDEERRKRYRAATLIVELRKQLADAQAQLAAKDAEIAGAFVAVDNFTHGELTTGPTGGWLVLPKVAVDKVEALLPDSARQAMEQVKQGAVEPYKNAFRHVEEFLGVHWESAQKEVFADNNFGWSMIAIEAIKKAMEQRIAEAVIAESEWWNENHGAQHDGNWKIRARKRIEASRAKAESARKEQ